MSKIITNCICGAQFEYAGDAFSGACRLSDFHKAHEGCRVAACRPMVRAVGSPLPLPEGTAAPLPPRGRTIC